MNTFGKGRRDGAHDLDVGRRQLAQVLEVENHECRIGDGLDRGENWILAAGRTPEDVPGAHQISGMDEGNCGLAPVPDAHVDPGVALVEQESARRTWPEGHRASSIIHTF